MYGQSREGVVVAMALPESVDLGEVERNLDTLGYDAPAGGAGSGGAGSGGVWAGSADLVAQIDPALTPVLQSVVVLPEERMVLMSDSAAYASSSAEVVRGESGSLGEGAEGVQDLADLAVEPVSAVLFASDFACEALSMSSADEEDQVLVSRCKRV